MALRSPTEFHNYWGAANPNTGAPWQFGPVPNLPNQTAFPAPTSQSANLQAGDFLYVPDPGPGVSNGQFYVCQDPGLPAQTNAVWVPVGRDQFAPKALVGNVPAGDSNVTTGFDGFYYFPDSGSGDGIQAALTLVSTLGFPIDIHVRPGTYDLSVASGGGPVGTLTVPIDCTLVGSGPSTLILANGSAGGDPLAIILSPGSTLRSLQVSIADSSDNLVSSSIVAVGDGNAGIVRVESVRSSLTRTINSTSALQSVYSVVSGTTAFFSNCDVTIVGTRSPESPPDSLCGWISASNCTLTDCTVSGGDSSMLFSSLMTLTGCQLSGFNLAGAYANGSGLLKASNCYVTSAGTGAYGIFLGPLSTLACANCQILMTDAQSSVGINSAATQGQIVGNQINAGGYCVDSSAGTNHAIGFNVLTSVAGTQLNTSATDEVAHNILL